MDMETFHKDLSIIKARLDQYSKKQYKYNTKTIEAEIVQLRYDLDQLVQILGCIADGYTELYKIIIGAKYHERS